MARAMKQLKLGKRNIRTLILGSVAFLAICYALLVVLEIPIADVILLVVISIALVAALALAALLVVTLWYGIKKVRRR